MKTSYDTTAFAKINLFLRVCGKYENGYHRLYMLMQQIGLGDDILVEFDDSRAFEIELHSSVPIPTGEDLCYKAAKAFYDRYSKITDSPLPFTYIKAVKVTPSQAGLGGGSSDAAAILQILQQHFNNPLSDEELLDISSKLGADVPFFLTGGSCICEGVGQIVTPLPDLTGVNLLLIKPQIGVSTAECYALSDEQEPLENEEEYKAMMNKLFEDEKQSPLSRIKAASPALINDLQAPAIKLAPVIEELIGAIKQTGSCFTAMTGSGSCVFGIYEDEASRDEAQKMLQEDPRTSGCLIIPSVMI